MSLYDGLDIDKSQGKDVSGWSSSLKLMQTQFQGRKPNTTGASKKKGPSFLAPVIDLKRPNQETTGEVRFNQQTGRIEVVQATSIGVPGSQFIAPDMSFSGVSDEYDPLRPNDYEKCIKRRREQKQREREEDRKKDLEERERRRKERHKERGYDPEKAQARLDSSRGSNGDSSKGGEMAAHHEEVDEDDYERPRRSGGAAIAPPTMLIEEPPIPADDQPQRPVKVGESFGLGGSVAAKMMARMGYKDGSGLGRMGQGMSMALQVEKTSKRGGKIIHERDVPKEPPRDAANTATTDLLKNPSKVVLLRNMVGPGEVDEMLESETAEECAKYGRVIKCVIFEMPECEEDEAVRIFVEFENVAAAIKSVIDLNGRFFGGRSVKAGFYNLDKFRHFDLSDPSS